MTLVTAWIRRVGHSEELVVASDSRLTGGISLNHAPKLFPLLRSDAVLAYCGPTLVAYPIILQIKAALDGHEETRDRLIDIADLKSHIEKSIEGLRAQIQDLPSGDKSNTSFKFILAGYSWKFSTFRAWTFKYDVRKGEFNAFSMPRTKRQYLFMSDDEDNERAAKARLQQLLQRPRQPPRPNPDWEPLQVLLSFIQDPEKKDIGGPPQILKVYKHANVMPINVLWAEEFIERGLKMRRHRINHLGRPLLEYESTRRLTLDPKTGELVEPWNIRDYIEASDACEERRVAHYLRARIAALLDGRRKSLVLQNELQTLVRRRASLEEIQEVLSRLRATCDAMRQSQPTQTDDFTRGMSRLQARGEAPP